MLTSVVVVEVSAVKKGVAADASQNNIPEIGIISELLGSTVVMFVSVAIVLGSPITVDVPCIWSVQ